MVGQGTRDRLQNSINIADHIVVPKAQHTVVILPYPTVANDIAYILGMLTPVDFDDQATLSADRIHDVRSNRLSPHEFHSVKRAGTKSIPKPLFRDRGISAQSSRIICLCNSCATHEAAPLRRNWRQGKAAQRMGSEI